MRHKGTPEHYFMANFANESKPSYYYHMNPKISMREKVGYSLGDVAANLVFQMMMIFQLKFYTDIFGLDGAVAGPVLLIARVADAFIDPLAGILSDRTQTRWGNTGPGCSGQPSPSACSTYWHSTIPASRTRRWWLFTPRYPTSY